MVRDRQTATLNTELSAMLVDRNRSRGLKPCNLDDDDDDDDDDDYDANDDS